MERSEGDDRPGRRALSAAIMAAMLCVEISAVAGQSGGNSQVSDPYVGARMTSSMAIIIVVLITAMFFMGFFSIYIRRCSDNNSGGSMRNMVAVVAGRSRRVRGLDATALQSLPTFAYADVKGLKIGKGALECAVCLNEFEDDETLRLIPKCDHVFHAECIDMWLASHTTCPVCRANLGPSESDNVIVPITDPDAVEAVDQVTVQIEGSESGVDAGEGSVSSRRDQQNIPSAPELSQSGPLRSMKMMFLSKFPRSHSTGHSVVQPGQSCERFTLRLPSDVRKQLLKRNLNRTASLVVMPRATSSCRGYRAAGDGSSRGKLQRPVDRLDHVAKSDPWVFSMAPPFISRASSLRSPKVAADTDAAEVAPKASPMGDAGDPPDANRLPV